MAQLAYEKEITGLVVIDPYNDFISEGGKVWDRLKGVAEGNQCVPHMVQVLEAARKAGIHVFYAMHHRYRPGDYETWKYITPIQKAAWSRKTFEYGNFESAHDWHLEVEEHKVGFEWGDLLQRVFAVLSLADDLDFRERFQAFTQHTSGDRLIINDKRPHHREIHPQTLP